MAKPTEDLDGLFRSLKALLVDFENPAPGVAFEARSSSDRDFDLWAVKDTVIEGRSHKELYFAGIRRQPTFVAFYFFPIYCVPELGSRLGAALMKRLKGKSCFRLVAEDPAMTEQIREALTLGAGRYRELGWL